MVGIHGFVFDGISHITCIATVDHGKETSRTSMSRLISAPFFSAHPVFRRAEYAAAVGRRPQDKGIITNGYTRVGPPGIPVRFR